VFTDDKMAQHQLFLSQSKKTISQTHFWNFRIRPFSKKFRQKTDPRNSRHKFRIDGSERLKTPFKHWRNLKCSNGKGPKEKKPTVL